MTATTLDRPATSARLLSALQVVHWRNVPLMAGLCIAAILMLMPFLWMVGASLRPAGEAYRLPPSIIPREWTLAAYREALGSGIPFVQMYWNSLVVAALSTLGVLVTASMAAFAFARLEFRGSTPLFLTMLGGLMVPPALTLIPLYFGFARLGLLDSLSALILPAMASSFGVYMMRQFMLSQPRELEEAALMDGASYWTIFWRISLPQLGPALAALGIITFTTSWNNYISPFVLIKSWDKMTLPAGIVALQGLMGAASVSVVMAAATMAILPLLLVFLVAQRFIIEGMTMSGLKQ